MNVVKTPYASKSEARRVKTQLGVDSDHEAVIHVYPVNESKFGVVVKVDGKGLKARLCNSKQDIIAYLGQVL